MVFPLHASLEAPRGARGRAPLRSPSTALLLGPLALALTACGGSSDPAPSTSFVIHSMPHAVSTGLAPVVDGGWLAYLAREFDTGPGGTDLNGNTITADDVPVAVDMSNQDRTVMDAAAANDQLELRDGHLWFIASEAIEADFLNADGDQSDFLLMHWTAGMTAPEVVTDVDATTTGEWMVWSGDRLYFPRADFTPAGDETTLAYVTAADPTTPIVVENQTGDGTLSPILLGEEAGLLFLALNETTELQNLNTSTGTDFVDGDQGDETVLALIDLNSAGPVRLKNTGVALAGLDTPITAYDVSGTDHLVAFLVSEADQGATDLNDPGLFLPAWKLGQCAGTPDGDSSDEVLFFLPYQSWIAGVTTAPINTGLVGTDRVVAMNGYVGTLSPELDANCDLNVDSDNSDTVFRWTSTALPVIPPSAATILHATAVMGGDSKGLAVFDGRWLIAVDEVLDNEILNSDGAKDDVLLAHIAPTGETAWTFTQNDIPGSSATFYVGVDWMDSSPQNGALPISLQEVEQGNTLNTECAATYNDGDAIDALPTWAEWDGTDLRFYRLRFAARTGNPGTVLTNDWVFTRISEDEHGRNLNGDSDTSDTILFRNARGLFCDPVPMATASDESGPVVVTRDNAVGCAFIASESQAGVDLNGDGDPTPNDLVVRWFVY